jgi:thiamine biosynthesis lipoprotein
MRARAVVVVVIALVVAAIVVRARRGGVAPGPAADGSAGEYQRFAQEIMAAPIEVLVPADGGDEAAETVFRIFREVDAEMSEWKPSSPLSAVSREAGVGPVEVPAALRGVIRRGLEIGELTDGAFDVTWAALWGLWDFKSRPPVVPDPGEIARRAVLVDFRQVVVDDDAGTVYLPRDGMVLGLGGIAKGHALDRAAEELRRRGVESFLISAAGQMMVGGRRGDRSWRVGIRDPRGERDDYFAWIVAEDVSVSTSGDYERFFVIDGRRYHHILDPRTGRPAEGVRSATVVSADATLADALSTALVILGIERALELVESLDGVDAVLVDDQATVHVTSGIAGRLELVHAPRGE